VARSTAIDSRYRLTEPSAPPTAISASRMAGYYRLT
jgi:hypothetical protein